MGVMVEGKWQTKDSIGVDPKFEREASTLRATIGDPEYPAQAGRYLLYVVLGCPWAHRTLVMRGLLGLEDAIDVVILADRPSFEDGWVFDPNRPDPAGRRALHEVYSAGVDAYTGRCTVPVLWDRETETIVNNESADIIRMMAQEMATFARMPIEMRPADLVNELDALNERIYRNLNNGVYRAGFAQSQAGHDAAVDDVFDTLDWLEARLADGREFLCGDRITEADVRLCTTLFRFEAYREVFYCDAAGPEAHPHVWAYRDRARRWNGVAPTLKRADDYKHGYAMIPFAAANNPRIDRRVRTSAA